MAKHRRKSKRGRPGDQADPVPALRGRIALLEGALRAAEARLASLGAPLNSHAGASPSTGPESPAAARLPQLLRLRVKFGSQPQFLAFVEQLSGFDDVAAVTVAGSTPHGATVLVELSREEPVSRPVPAVQCVQCGKTIAPGDAPVSHGLCPACTGDFLRAGSFAPGSGN